MARLFFCPSQFIVLDCSFDLPSPYFCHFCHPAKPIQWFDGQIWTIQVSFVSLGTLHKVFYVSFLHQKIKATPHTKVRMVCCVNINMWVKWCVRKWVFFLVLFRVLRNSWIPEPGKHLQIHKRFPYAETKKIYVNCKSIKVYLAKIVVCQKA